MIRNTLLLFWSIICVLGISANYSHYTIGDWIIILTICILPFAMVYLFSHRSTKFSKRQTDLRNEMMSMIDSETLEPITDSRLLLHKDEIAYFEYSASLIITKNKLLGTTGKSGGANVRIAKGIYLRSGNYGSRKIYGDVTTKYNGILTITNQRISFLNSEKGVDIPLNKLTNVDSTFDNLILQYGNKIYDLNISNADILEHLIRVLIQ